jgi:threonine/homoserine/homoserine lactone efflux protein/nucleoside-diphosphate-sugar epimerase
MSQEILVIGGTRYFGIRLVEALLDAGERVTIATRGRTPDPFGARVRRIAVDRGDATALQAAFADARFDIVYDQMCYGPDEAALAARVFAGKVGRYLMTSTLEVYDALHARVRRAYREDDLDPAQPVTRPPTAYGDGKRRAEAVLLAARGLPVATLRLAHVLGGAEDFTGRLRGHVEAVLNGEVLRHVEAPGETSFIDVPGVVALMVWAGRQVFAGPLNVAADGALTAGPHCRAAGAERQHGHRRRARCQRLQLRRAARDGLRPGAGPGLASDAHRRGAGRAHRRPRGRPRRSGCMNGIQHLGAFLLAALLVIAVPGPATLFVLGQARAAGSRAALAVAGLVVGDLLLITAAALGLGMLLQQWPAALLALRFSGALYVAWLGLAMVRSAPAADALPPPSRAAFAPALLLTLLNPKPILFFGAFFPLFLARDGSWLAGFMRLGLLFELVNIAWFALLIALATRLRTRLPAGRWLSRLGGLGLLGCAALVLVG